MEQNGYIVFYMPQHHLSDKNGKVFQHQIIAQQKLGRKLLKGQVVHHRDKNRSNNNPNNLIVFATKADHTSFHQRNCDQSILEQQENGSYIVPMRSSICPVCGKKKDTHASVCRQCYLKDISKYRQRCQAKPDKDILLQQLYEYKGNFTKLAKTYGITDNGVRKWCKFYGIPYHSRDYK